MHCTNNFKDAYVVKGSFGEGKVLFETMGYKSGLLTFS